MIERLKIQVMVFCFLALALASVITGIAITAVRGMGAKLTKGGKL